MNADESPNLIDLSRETQFALGDIEVRPSTRELAVGVRREVLEPRVMQVLVALARRRGEVVSRSDLTTACWGGRAVSEDAINRSISLVRRLAETLGGFSIETVARVGYRLDVVAAAPNAAVRPSATPRLAVLPFENLSADPDLSYFSDGVSEEILDTVARVRDLKVISRASSFQFRGADKAVGRVAAELNATHLLDGSVRRSGERVRIAARLVECASDTTIWAERFDRDLSDVFALQDEIAAAVAAALQVAFAPAAQAESVDPAAYTLYLKARELRNRGLLSHKTMIAVIELLDEATSLAPRFARAWEFLAAMKVEHLRFDAARQQQGKERSDVVAAAETALRLDPTLGGAHQSLGQLEPFGRFAEREAFHMKALSVAPNDTTVLTSASLFFAEVGRMRTALEYARQAYSLDPMYPWAANWYAVALQFAGRGVDRDLWRSLRTRWPDNELIAWGALWAACDDRDWTWLDELAGAAHERGLLNPSLLGALSIAAMLRTPGPAIQRWLDDVRGRLAQTGVLAAWEIKTTHGLGLKDEAFELIGQASFAYVFDPHMGSPNGVAGTSMIFDGHSNTRMMSDIRFVGLCAKLGLCDYWVATDRWPDCAETVAPYYDFKAEARRLAS
jgi:adenylate cyclase